MLDPQYLQESTSETEEEQLPGDPVDLIKTEFPTIFGPSIPPVSPPEGASSQTSLEENGGDSELGDAKKKEHILSNATKICLKFQLSSPPQNTGKILCYFENNRQTLLPYLYSIGSLPSRFQ